MAPPQEKNTRLTLFVIKGNLHKGNLHTFTTDNFISGHRHRRERVTYSDNTLRFKGTELTLTGTTSREGYPDSWDNLLLNMPFKHLRGELMVGATSRETRVEGRAIADLCLDRLN